jgi:stage II sporulation protein D
MPLRVRSLLPIAALTLAGYGCGARHPVVPPPAVVRGPLELRIGIATTAGTVVAPIELEEYVAGVVLGELGEPRIDRRAGENLADVQALIARTYALANRGRHRAQGYDLCAGTHCQLFRRAPAGGFAQAAAQRTASRFLAFDGAPIQAVYHASCGGRTSEADLIWLGRPLPYLASVADMACAAEPWRWQTSTRALRAALNADTRTRVADRLLRIDVLARDEAGRAVRVALVGERAPIVTGEELRTVVARTFGAASIRSALFDVRVAGEVVTFDGRGLGHGVGLCQRGARARAAAGASADEILHYYYPGTVITPSS